MTDIDWTPVLVALLGGGGLLVAIIQMIAGRSKPTNRAAEDRAVAATDTPGSPGHDTKALSLAQQAMDQVSLLSGKLTDTEDRLMKVEERLSVVSASYESLYRWVRRLIDAWDEARQEKHPPRLPDDIHHP